MSSLSHVETIFFAALEKNAPDERAGYLEAACGRDLPLRQRVERLLNAYPRVGDFLQEPALAGGANGDGGRPATTDRSLFAEGPGTVIGPYKLLEQIGEGGFGVVFMAEQERPIRRKVALKIVKPGMDSRAVIARFEAERQALAMMDHPNIARVLDGGSTESGRPYFAMDLVRGLLITEFCDQNQLPPKERLKLFVSVCAAVQHAHQNGIIHRDLKPGNVLVTLHDGVGVVKVIDFGIAKALGRRLTDKTLFTGFAQMIGTPLYMSPEQAEMSGLDVDTRSDIYSLGVLLYELLTGTTPFEPDRLREVGHDEMRRIIREEEPPKPSVRIGTLNLAAATTISGKRGSDPRRLSRQVRGELDWIVMRSLEKDRRRRYETAGAFAADVERYLRGEAVEACPPSVAYRVRKFVRRNHAALGVTAAVLFVLGFLAGGIGWVARDHAARETALDVEVDRVLDEAASQIEASKWPAAAAAVERAEKLLVAAGRPERPSRLLELRGDVTMVERLEEIYRRPEKEDYFTGQEQDAKFAQAFRDYGIDVAALPFEESAERIRGRRIRLELVRTLDFWSSMRRRSASEAVPDWKQLLRIAKAADADASRNQLRDLLERSDSEALKALADSTDVSRSPPATLHLMANALVEAGAAPPALFLLRKAHRQYPDDLWINDALGWLCLSTLRQYDDAVRYYTAARALRPRSPFLSHAVGRALFLKGAGFESVDEFSRALHLKPDYVQALWGRGDAYLNIGEPDKALDDFSRVIELEPHSAEAWFHRGFGHTKLKVWDRAMTDYSRAVELDPNHAPAWSNRSWVFNKLGEWEKAIDDASKAIELDPNNKLSWGNRGCACAKLGRWKEAAVDFSRAIELDSAGALWWINRGAARHCLGENREALDDLSKAVELEPAYAQAWHFRGLAHKGLGQWDQAMADLTRAIELDPNCADAWSDRGLAQVALGREEQAAADFAHVLELDPNHGKPRDDELRRLRDEAARR